MICFQEKKTQRHVGAAATRGFSPLSKGCIHMPKPKKKSDSKAIQRKETDTEALNRELEQWVEKTQAELNQLLEVVNGWIRKSRRKTVRWPFSREYRDFLYSIDPCCGLAPVTTRSAK